MIPLRIVLDADGAFPELEGSQVRKAHAARSIAVAALQGGLKSGGTSIAFVIPLEDGSHVFAETTLKLFLTAADAMKARFGDPRQDDVPPDPNSN